MNIFCVLADAGDWFYWLGGVVFIICIVLIPEWKKAEQKGKKAEETRKNAEETRKNAEETRKKGEETQRREQRRQRVESRRREETRAEAHKRVSELMSREGMTADICYSCKGMGKIQSGSSGEWTDCDQCGGIGYTYEKNNP